MGILKRIRWQRTIILTLIICVLSGFGGYKLLTRRQEYSASTVIRFSGKDVSRGYIPDGSLTENAILELKGTEVLSQAAERIEGVTPDELSKNLTIEEIIPELETERKDSAMKNGHDYEYHPNEYLVTYKTETKAEDPKETLNAVTDSFFKCYMKNHVLMSDLPPNGGVIVNSTYDFIENADILFAAIENMEWYMEDMETRYATYRSYKTGYTYSDLAKEFKTLKDWKLAELYAEILRGKLTKDPQTLKTKLIHRTEVNAFRTENSGEDLGETEELLNYYAEKNKVKGVQHKYESDVDNSIDENHTNILDLVYENGTRPKPAYDDIIQKYISGSDVVSSMLDDTDYNNYLLKVFEGAEPASEESRQHIQEMIESICEDLNRLYDATEATSEEHRGVLSVDAVKAIGTPYLISKYRIRLYTLAFMAGMGVFAFLGLVWLQIVAGNVNYS